jgi:putative transposase
LLQQRCHHFDNKTIVVTRRGRICLGKSISVRSLPARRSVSKKLHDDIWLVSFMNYDLGYDLETRVLEPLENPFGPKVLPMS